MKAKITAVLLILIVCLVMVTSVDANQNLYNIHNTDQKTLCLQEDYSFIECYRLNLWNNEYNNTVISNTSIQDKTLFNNDRCIISNQVFLNCPFSENMIDN